MESSWNASIKGEGLQYLDIELLPGGKIQADAGAMIYSDGRIPVQAASNGGIWGAIKRGIGGGATFFLQTITNEGAEPRHVTFSSSHGGQIVSINLDDLKGELILNGNAFLAGIGDFEFDIYRVKGLTGWIASSGPVMQRLTGSGQIWVQATGAMIERTLSESDSIVVNAGALLAFDSQAEYEGVYKGVGSMLLNQRIFLGRLRGPGKVWMQTASLDKTAAALIPYLPVQNRTGN